MKYLKLFESYIDDLKKNRDDIIKVLSSYVKLYNDGLVNELFELIWSESEEAGNRIEDNGNEIDEESIRLLIDDVISSGWGADRVSRKIMDIYYDCNYNLAHNSVDVVETLKDIFVDYFDEGKAKIWKSSDKHDNRYIVLIDQIDVLLTLDFKEIMNRVKDLIKIKHLSYSGNGDQIKFEFYESYPDDED